MNMTRGKHIMEGRKFSKTGDFNVATKRAGNASHYSENAR
jgi:hypothetical protein